MTYTVLLLVVALALGILVDPYTFHHNASDVALAAPWWQTGLALLAVGLLGLSAWYLLGDRVRVAGAVLSFETCYTLIVCIGFVLRDGASRFTNGFGDSTWLALFLALIVVRIAVIGTLFTIRIGTHWADRA